MRVVRRVAERAVDPRLELLGDHVLEPVGLVVDGVEVRGRASARGRARAGGGGGSPRARPARRRPVRRAPRYGSCSISSSAASFFTIAEADAGETRCSRATRRDRDAPAVRLELVDRLQVVLDRLGERQPRHGDEGTGVASVAPRCGSASGIAQIRTTRSCSGPSRRVASTSAGSSSSRSSRTSRP